MVRKNVTERGRQGPEPQALTGCGAHPGQIPRTARCCERRGTAGQRLAWRSLRRCEPCGTVLSPHEHQRRKQVDDGADLQVDADANGDPDEHRPKKRRCREAQHGEAEQNSQQRFGADPEAGSRRT